MSEQPTDTIIPTPAEESSRPAATEFVNQTPITIPKPPDNPANTVPSKTLWMGDLEAWWDEDYISQIWQKLDKHVEVKVIKPKNNLLMHQLAKTNGQGIVNHSGYCFIEFESPESANDALSLNGTAIADSNNKTFRLNWASAATLDSQVAQTPEYSLFVGDLSDDTTEAHLLALFQSHFDSIKTVRVMTDPSSGLSRCFGFVRFTNDEDRKKALSEMNGQWLGDRQIRVALASPKQQMKKMRNNQFPNYPGDFNQQYNNQMKPDFRGQSQQFRQSQNRDFDDPYNTTVFVGGLAKGLNEDTLMALFEAFGPIVDIKVPPGKGCGFVNFIERQDAENAIEGLHGFIIGGSRIRLSWGRPNKPRTFIAPIQSNPHMQNMPPINMGMNMGMAMNMIPPNSMNSMNLAFNNMSLDNRDIMTSSHGVEPPFMQGLPHGIPQGIPQMHQGMHHGIPPQGMTHGMPPGMPGMPPTFIYDPYFGNPVSAGSHPPPSQPNGMDDGNFMYPPHAYQRNQAMNESPRSLSPELNEQSSNQQETNNFDDHQEEANANAKASEDEEHKE